MDSLREYLREKNLLFSMDDIENSIDKESLMNRVEEAKIKYRKSYLKKKKQEYRKSKHRVEFSLSKEGKSSEYDLVKKRAKNKKLGVFMKECALAYLQNEYVIPNDDLINNCIKEIAAYREDRNKEGRNIKHIVDKANRRGYTIPEDLEDLKQRLYKLNNLEYTFSLEDKIEQLLRYPEEELLDFLRRKFEDNPSLVSQVGELVQTFKM
ncbi:MAG: hypothetical protein ACPG5P_02315 [Saprospiraceae bacterium]